MEVAFEDPALQKLESDPAFTAGFEAAIVKAFRKRMQLIRAAVDERTFYAMKSLHYEKLKGNRDGQRSMRLNDQWRLVLRLQEDEAGKLVVVVSIRSEEHTSELQSLMRISYAVFCLTNKTRTH